MADRAAPKLPSCGLCRTAALYGRMGFREDQRNGGWMILSRGGLVIEFVPDPDLDPLASAFGCCLDFGAFCARFAPQRCPRRGSDSHACTPPERQARSGRIGGLVDPDGSLLRLIGR